MGKEETAILGKEETKKEETATLSNKIEKATSTTKAEKVTLTSKEETMKPKT